MCKGFSAIITGLSLHHLSFPYVTFSDLIFLSAVSEVDIRKDIRKSRELV